MCAHIIGISECNAIEAKLLFVSERRKGINAEVHVIDGFYKRF